MDETLHPGSYIRLRFLILALQVQQLVRWACDLLRFGRSPGIRVCAALVYSTVLFFLALIGLSLIGAPSLVALVVGVGLLLVVLSAFSMAVLIGTDQAIAAKRSLLERQLPAARQAWQAYRAKVRAEREERRQERLARERDERERARAEAAREEEERDRRREERTRNRHARTDSVGADELDDLPRWLLGDGTFALEVVGESHYQRELEWVCGEPTERGEDRVVWAWLELDDGNPYDPKAVSVVIEGVKVGHLSRTHARAFRARLRKERVSGYQFPCRANIRGGWDRGPDDRGHYGVWLDVRLYSRVR